MDRRFEFRIFGRELGALPKMFAREGKEIGHDSSVSLYLVSRLNIEANVKIREGQLEVKTLEARQRQLELWRLSAKEKLPVTAEFANNHVFAPLGLDHVDLPGEAAIGIEEFAAIADDFAALYFMEIQKNRVQYSIGPGLAEYVHILWEDGSAESVGLEADRPEAVQNMMHLFALEAMENWSYPTFLQRTAFDPPSELD